MSSSGCFSSGRPGGIFQHRNFYASSTLNNAFNYLHKKVVASGVADRTITFTFPSIPKGSRSIQQQQPCNVQVRPSTSPGPLRIAKRAADSCAMTMRHKHRRVTACSYRSVESPILRPLPVTIHKMSARNDRSERLGASSMTSSTTLSMAHLSK